MVGGRTPYRKGYAFEHKVRKALRKHGWAVRRSHGSAFPDLICYKRLKDTFNHFEVIAVECTIGGTVSEKKYNKAERYYHDYQHMPVFLAFSSNKRKKDIKKFGENEILLRRLFPLHDKGVLRDDTIFTL